MSKLDAFSRDYLRLLLEIHAHHIDGYVDSYYGPPELKAEVEATPPQQPAELLAIITDLRGRIPSADPARAAFLEVALRGVDLRLEFGRAIIGIDVTIDVMGMDFQHQPQVVAAEGVEL